MEFNEWKEYYQKILKDFGYKQEEDEKSALYLSRIVYKENLIETSDLKNMLFGETVYIFGAALPKKITDNFDGVLISADGATTALLENNILPHIIVSDLDGKAEDQIFANENGSIEIIHAHGDNIFAVKKYVPKFKGKIFCTTQSKPFKFVNNFGGFTDGDRAVFLAEHFGAKKINLVGFDFEKIGKYSFSSNEKLKLKKLKWAKILIDTIDKSKICFYAKFAER